MDGGKKHEFFNLTARAGRNLANINLDGRTAYPRGECVKIHVIQGSNFNNLARVRGHVLKRDKDLRQSSL